MKLSDESHNSFYSHWQYVVLSVDPRWNRHTQKVLVMNEHYLPKGNCFLLTTCALYFRDAPTKDKTSCELNEHNIQR